MARDSHSAFLYDNPLLEADESFAETACWIVLGRELDDGLRRELLRMMASGAPRTSVLLSLLTSAEFLLRWAGLLDDSYERAREQRVETLLASRGTDAEAIDAIYRCLLGRGADGEGLRAYEAHVREGLGRTGVIRILSRSEEFDRRYRHLCPANGIVPRDEQLCELANPAKWDNPDWMAILRELKVPPTHRLTMHRKGYEFAQTVFALRKLGALDDGTSILSVGAGHEALTYFLANHAQRVIGTDLYQGVWIGSRAAEGDIRVVSQPEVFAPFEYRRDRLRFLQMNGRALAFRDATFDVAYSLSSIEHFGGWQGAREAVEEMARVTRPGGVVVIATDWCVSGPTKDEVFSPAEVYRLLDVPGVSLVEPIDERVWSRYRGGIVDLQVNPYQTPHMLLKDGDTVFTSVFVVLRRH